MKSISAPRLVKLTLVIAMFLNASLAEEQFSHSDWNFVLASYVDEHGMVAYDEIAGDRAPLDSYLNALNTSGPKTTPDLFENSESRLAYYINAYNALVFEGVLNRGPERESVWRGLISGYNFFVRMKVDLDGQTTNLKNLEDDLIRTQFADPRIHAAINCASISCPRLRQAAYMADSLDDQLDAAILEFVNDERHVRFDVSRNTLYLSRIFDWFEDDFLEYEKSEGNERPEITDYINRYIVGDRIDTENLRVRYLKYEKGINSQQK